MLDSVYLYVIFPECFRFCCLMAGAIYWAGFPQLWLSRFCSVSEPFEVNSNILQGSCSLKPHLFDKSYCTKWNGKLGRWSVMMICFLLEFKRQWENSHALPSETAGSEGRYSSEFKLWWTMFLFPSPGHKVVVVRCEGINISGNFYRNKRTWLNKPTNLTPIATLVSDVNLTLLFEFNWPWENLHALPSETLAQ